VELVVPIARRSYLQGAVTGSTIRSIVVEHPIEIRQRRIALVARLEEIRWATGRQTRASKLAAREATWLVTEVVAQESVIVPRGLEVAIVQGAQV
jgi:hypothetical protein